VSTATSPGHGWRRGPVRGGTKTAAGHPDPTPSPDWHRIEQAPEYRELRGRQRRFLIPATVAYLAGYFGFLILAAAGPGFFGDRVHGGLNGGLLIMVAAYLLVWLLVLAYIRTADRRFDPLAAKVRALADEPRADEPGADEPRPARPGTGEGAPA
jgi:uncharacterized membrane protein (DUF485 family)